MAVLALAGRAGDKGEEHGAEEGLLCTAHTHDVRKFTSCKTPHSSSHHAVQFYCSE